MVAFSSSDVYTNIYPINEWLNNPCSVAIKIFKRLLIGIIQPYTILPIDSFNFDAFLRLEFYIQKQEKQFRLAD